MHSNNKKKQEQIKFETKKKINQVIVIRDI